VADENLLARLLRCFHHFVAVGRGERHRLLDEYVLAGFERGDRRFGVQVRRQAQIDQVDFRIAKQFLDVAVLRQSRRIDLLARRPEIALDTAPIARQLLRIASTNRRQLHSLRLLVGKVVNPAHKADAG
jgi:hypothetical protein